MARRFVPYLAVEIDTDSVGAPIVLRAELDPDMGKPARTHAFAASLDDRFYRNRPCPGGPDCSCAWGIELFPRTERPDDPAARATFASVLLSRLDALKVDVANVSELVAYAEIPIRFRTPFEPDWSHAIAQRPAWGVPSDPPLDETLGYLDALLAVRRPLVAQLLDSPCAADAIGDGELFALVESLDPAARLLAAIVLEHAPSDSPTLDAGTPLGQALKAELPLLTDLSFVNPVPVPGSGELLLRRGKRLRPKEPRRGLLTL